MIDSEGHHNQEMADMLPARPYSIAMKICWLRQKACGSALGAFDQGNLVTWYIDVKAMNPYKEPALTRAVNRLHRGARLVQDGILLIIEI